jgi:hypothetical protein
LNRLDANYACGKAVICRSLEYRDKGDSPKHHTAVIDQLRKHTRSEPEIVDFSLDKPVQFLKEFMRKAGGYSKQQSVTVDITTFPRQEMMLLLKLFDQQPDRGSLRLLYAEPGKYATESQNKEDRWLTRGVTAVHSIPGFCGIQYPQLGKLLVMILGHEGERTFITLRRHQPDKVILLAQGEKQYRVGLAKISSLENQNLIDQFGPGAVWSQELPAHGVAETQNELEQIIRSSRSQYNVFVASNGTKLQLVGSYMAIRNYLEVQVTYACPALYNWEHYSNGCGSVWEMIIPPSEWGRRKVR